MNLPNPWLLYIAAICILLSITLLNKEKERPAVIILFFAAFFLRLFMAYLDPFLSDWDEKFHALVARNMMEEPLVPRLKTEILIPFDKTTWCCNTIWLHKQPLFLWQMALSMKIFGVSEFVIRYPSVLLGALMVPLVYRIAKLYTGNKFTAFAAALCMCCSNYQLELTSGYNGMDHNDVAFGFYVLASIWAYAEYMNSKKKMLWLILIGLFAGCAVLNKWLVGLLVFLGWGINILVSLKNKETRKEILHLLAAVCICAIVFVPWQLYILNTFPNEAQYEYAYNAKHIFEVVEGHKGHNEYYLHKFHEYFGHVIWILVIAGVLVTLFKKNFNRRINIAILVYAGVVYIFFSLIVASKLPSYFFVVAPLCYIYMAVVVGLLYKLPKGGNVVFTAVVICCAGVLLNPVHIQQNHDAENSYRKAKISNTNIYKNAKSYLPADIDIVMNLPIFEDVEFMFYNPGLNAFHYCYSPENFDVLKKSGKKVAVFKNYSGNLLPTYITDYEGTYVIDTALTSSNEYYR